jgi:solute carrier family 10 (sodium/bile acid cotransporter), member 7
MNSIKQKLSAYGIDWFLPAIFLMVIAAYFMPELGMIKKPFSLTDLTNWGISGIFFLYGLKLNLSRIKSGLLNWKVHLLIQSTTFIIFPLLILILRPFFKGMELNQLWLGIFFLAALPSTVSSSVVMVSIAEGNIPSAIFNASISALIGVFITPLWIGMLFQNSIKAINLTDSTIQLFVQVIVPVLIGMLFHKYFGSFAEKNKASLKTFDQIVILLIIYNAFCNSFSEDVFGNMSLIKLALLSLGMLLLFFIVLFLTKTISRFLNLNRADSITVMFCGSKKSLVHGTVMAGVLFAGNPITGYILLPLMLYHALQLIASSILAKKMALNN